MTAYIIQGTEQDLSLSLLKSLGRVLSLEAGIREFEAVHQVKHSYGIIEVSSESIARRLSSAFKELGFDHFILLEEELVTFPRMEVYDLKLATLGNKAELLVAAKVIKDKFKQETPDLSKMMVQSSAWTGSSIRRYVEQTTHIDIYTQDKHFGTSTNRLSYAAIEECLRRFIGSNESIRLSKGAKMLIEGKPEHIPRFSDELQYHRYRNWMVQLRFAARQSLFCTKDSIRDSIHIHIEKDIFQLKARAPAFPESKLKKENFIRQGTVSREDHKKVGGYRILKTLGEGGMGIVYKAEQISLGRVVAVKVLPPRLANDAAFVQRFLNEARAIAALNHPNIVQIYDVCQEGQTYFYTMELIEGKSLDEILARRGTLSLKQSIDIISKTAIALEYMHKRGIVHRDIKPSNIMLGRSGVIKLMDFGLALQRGKDRMTTVGGILGTPEYMSPEQALGKTATSSSDIYSLGVVFYELMTGQVPFEADTPLGVITKIQTEQPPSPRVMNPEIGQGVEKIILKMMAKKPGKRYSSCRAILADLRGARSSEQ